MSKPLPIINKNKLWDWKTIEKFQIENEFIALKAQIVRINICHYTFLHILHLVIHGIGNIKPGFPFSGCGNFSPEIKGFALFNIADFNSRVNENASLIHSNSEARFKH